MRVLGKRVCRGLATLYLAGLEGEERWVEFVDTLEPGVPKEKKWVMMVSTQVGCPVGCRMCDAGALGYRGNLSAEEILAQVRRMAADNPGLDLAGHPKVKIHLSRMGEPSLNPATLTALERLAEEYPYPGVLPALSTVAPKSPVLEPYFRELAALKDALYPGGRFQLQFSVHSTDERLRRNIVPIKTWALEEIAEYGARFVRPGDRKITLNFALGPGETLDARKLRRLFPVERFLVKITPVHPTRTSDAGGTTFLWSEAPAAIQAAAGELRSLGFDVLLSPSLPEEIAAATACGQLWSEDLKERALTMTRNRARDEGCYVTAGTLAARSSAWREELAGRLRQEIRLEPGKAGLVVVDMQAYFLDPRGPAYRPQARAVLGRVKSLVEAFRGAGRPVFFLGHAHVLDGAPRPKVASVLGPREEEVFWRNGSGAFSAPRLAGALRRGKVEQLAVAGLMTNLCVASTVRDAVAAGFQAWPLLDATAAHTEELHVAALRALALRSASVPMTEELLAALEGRARTAYT